MESLNSTLFLWINATPTSPHWLLQLASFFARDMIAIVPALIVALWLWAPRAKIHTQRILVMKTTVALIYAMAISWCLGQLFPHPRPFVVGLGYQFLPHAPDNSYPSNHGTAIFTVALAFICWHHYWSGLLLLFIGGAIAWARICLGIHWPLDMLGSLLVGGLGCLFSRMAWKLYGDRLMRCCHLLYRWLFAIPIRKGWVRY